MSEKLLLLVDGSSYLYRAYHAMPDLRAEGFPTGAIHGVVAMLKRLRQQYAAGHAACVFDAKGPTFRDDWYADYKAHRSPMPEDLALQIEPIHEAVRLLGWPVLEVPGVEADDTIGTLCRAAVEQGLRVVVSTGDKDLAQLVNERVTLINTMSNETLDVAGVGAKFGVAPNRIVDYLTLLGDAVDNVPGVDKVGPKTAVKWLAEHGSLDGVIAAAAGFKGQAGDNLRAALDWLPQGRRLVTVRTDCDLAGHVDGWPSLDALALRDLDRDGLLAFYRRHGFRTWRQELEAAIEAERPAAPPRRRRETAAGQTASLPGMEDSEEPGEAGEPAGPPPARVGAEAAPTVPAGPPSKAVDSAGQPLAHDYETVVDRARLGHWIERLKAADLAAVDTETDSLDAMRARVVGISFAVEAGRAAYVPLAHDYPGVPDQLPAQEVLDGLRPWLEDAARAKVGQNVKYDLQVLANAGIQARGFFHDTMLQSYVLEAHRGHGLEALADRHLERKGLSYEDVCGKGVAQIPFAQVELGRAALYSGEDSEMTLDVHRVLWPRLVADERLRWVYEHLEMPVVGVLQRIERHGVLIDAAQLARQSAQLAERMVALEQEAYELAGQPFNMGSPKQIGEILFVKLGLPVKRRTAAGAPSTDEAVLGELAADYPLPARILEHRGLAKLKGTYTDKLPLMVNPDTGRVHTTYAQAVAVTGRLSSNDPNLQNIPIRTAEGRRVREAFVAPPGHVLMSADYSQIELRIMAHISDDPALLSAFERGLDVHRATAAEMFSVAVDGVSAEQRRYAKTINFGLMYGMGTYGLAANLGIEQKTAKDFIERYFARFAGVKRFMDDTRAQAKAQGFVETVFGRRLWLPEINSGNGPRRAAAERQAINAPMQGTAADLIKLAMVVVQQALDDERRATRMVLQVHDELVFEVPDAELAWAREAVPRLMAGVAQLKVPLLAEVGVGPNWEQAH